MQVKDIIPHAIYRVTIKGSEDKPRLFLVAPTKSEEGEVGFGMIPCIGGASIGLPFEEVQKALDSGEIELELMETL